MTQTSARPALAAERAARAGRGASSHRPVQRSLGSPARGDNVFDEDQYPLGRDAQMAYITDHARRSYELAHRDCLDEVLAHQPRVCRARCQSRARCASRLPPGARFCYGLLVASKHWHDGRVFNLDYTERLDEYITLPHLNAMEAEFLGLLDYRTTISASFTPSATRRFQPSEQSFGAWLTHPL